MISAMEEPEYVAKLTASVLVVLSLLGCGTRVDGDGVDGQAGSGGGTATTDAAAGTGGAGGVTPCHDLPAGASRSECVDWLVERCAELEPTACAEHRYETSAGLLGCIAAGAFDESASCTLGEPARCVAALHTGEGGDFLFGFLDQGVAWKMIPEEGSGFRPNITYGFEACVGQHVCCGGEP